MECFDSNSAIICLSEASEVVSKATGRMEVPEAVGMGVKVLAAEAGSRADEVITWLVREAYVFVNWRRGPGGGEYMSAR